MTTSTSTPTVFAQGYLHNGEGRVLLINTVNAAAVVDLASVFPNSCFGLVVDEVGWVYWGVGRENMGCVGGGGGRHYAWGSITISPKGRDTTPHGDTLSCG